MTFNEKYARESEKTKPENKDKKVISDDAFAIGEIIDLLSTKLNYVIRSK